MPVSLSTAIEMLIVMALSAVAWGTVTRQNWGVRFGRVNCPRCLRLVPPDANPLRRLLLGGGTCTECHTAVNKWGREVMPNRAFRLAQARAAKRSGATGS